MTSFEPLQINSERLLLRWLDEADLPELFAIYSDAEVMRYWSSPPYTYMAQAELLLADVRAGYASGNLLELGIQRLSDQAMIGTCTLHSFQRTSRRAEVGYALGRPYWGQGYMQEALRLLIDYAFTALDLNRLEADIDPRNLASAKTLERLGFRQEGLLRQRWIVDGEVSDTAFYGLLRGEWRNGSENQ